MFQKRYVSHLLPKKNTTYVTYTAHKAVTMSTYLECLHCDSGIVELTSMRM